MAASSQPTRSISFPSRFHPNCFKIEETVKNLKFNDFSSASSTIEIGLLSLVELYGHVQDLILSLSTQQALLCHDQGNLVEQALDNSVGLLDTCSTARDLILRLNEQAHDLHSALCRKGCLSIESEVGIYMGFRKKMTKDVARCIKKLNQVESKSGLMAAAISLDLDPYLVMVIRVLREVYGITIGVFRSLFMFLSMPTKASGWLLLSRLVTKRRCVLVGSNRSQDIFINEVAAVDLAVYDMNVDVEVVRGRLQALDVRVGILEGVVECLFKCLVQNRVSFLNILTC